MSSDVLIQCRLYAGDRPDELAHTRPSGCNSDCRPTVASAEEAAKLLAALPEADRPLWATAFYAGLRRGELQALRWSDVDLGRSEIRVERSWDQVEGAIEPKSRRKSPHGAAARDPA